MSLLWILPLVAMTAGLIVLAVSARRLALVAGGLRDEFVRLGAAKADIARLRADAAAARASAGQARAGFVALRAGPDGSDS